MAYDEADVAFSPAWVVLWVWNVAALAVYAALHFPPRDFAASLLVGFLLPEMVGLRRHRDALPPLTYVVRRYVPRWVPTAVTFGVGAWMAFAFLPVVEHPAVVGSAIAGLVGWLDNHWAVTYSD